MGTEAFGLALLLALLAAAGSAGAVGAWSRYHEARLLLVAAAQWILLALGVLFAYGQVSTHPPADAHVPLPVLAALALVALFLVAGSLIPRRRSG